MVIGVDMHDGFFFFFEGEKERAYVTLHLIII